MLTNPTWLFAIAALAIPVVIHLWNIRPGKTLKVGSIALIGAASRKSSRSFNLLDILLLVLRCLFLLVLALLLARPFWNKTTQTEKLKGWILIPRQNIHQVYRSFKPKIDSLIRVGYQLHYFNDGFTAIDTIKFKTLADSAKGAPLNNWTLLKKLSNAAPKNLPLYVFAANSLNNIGGAKPALVLNLHIQTFSPADSTQKWISNAAITNAEGVFKVTEGNSSPKGTTFINSVVQKTNERSSQYQINTNNGRLSVAFKNDSVNKPVDTTTLKIAIYAGKGRDAEYLKAALNAVQQFTYRKINIRLIADGAVEKVNADWLFWLKEEHAALIAAKGIKHVFIYQPGKPQNTQSTVIIPGVEKIALNKRIAASSPQGQILWQDGFGNPVLSRGDDNVYHFYSRFDPLWNDMVWSNEFPKVMLNLLFNSTENSDKLNDKRAVDDTQVEPLLTVETAPLSTTKITGQADLTKAFWIALVLLFIAERLLAHRAKSTENYG